MFGISNLNVAFHSGMIHDYKGLPKTSRAGANVAVWLLCLQTVCYAGIFLQ